MDKVTIEEQIRRAKQRAEEFSNSLLKARAQEAEVLENFEKEKLNMSFERKALEKERIKLSRAFDEKNNIVEQLERKLSSNMDALSLGNTNSDKSLIDSNIRSPNRIENRSMTSEIGNYNFWDSNFDDKNGPELIRRHHIAEIGKDQSNEIKLLNAEVKILKEEVELLRSCKIDNEGKLKFRLEQVVNYEEIKNKLEKEIIELNKKNASLEKENKFLKLELANKIDTPQKVSEIKIDEKFPQNAVDLITCGGIPPLFTPPFVTSDEVSPENSINDESIQQESIKNILQETKKELTEIVRASQTQELLQKYLDNHDVSENIDENSQDIDKKYEEEPVFSRTDKLSSKTRFSSSFDSNTPSGPTATSSVLSYSGFNENDDITLMSSVTNLNNHDYNSNNIAYREIKDTKNHVDDGEALNSANELKSKRPKSAPVKIKTPSRPIVSITSSASLESKNKLNKKPEISKTNNSSMKSNISLNSISSTRQPAVAKTTLQGSKTITPNKKLSEPPGNRVTTERNLKKQESKPTDIKVTKSSSKTKTTSRSTSSIPIQPKVSNESNKIVGIAFKNNSKNQTIKILK